MIVERLGRGVHRAARRERELQGLLGAGLADAAGDGDDHRTGGTRAGGAAEIVQRFERVADADQPLLVARRKGAVDDGAGGALIERRGDEGMPVAVRPANGDKALALAEAAGVDGEAGDRRLGRAEARAARGGRRSRLGSTAVQPHFASCFSAAATASWSENGITVVPTVCPVSWPLPATSRTSPGSSLPIASAIASARSPISMRAGRGSQDLAADGRRIFAARIVVGDDGKIGLGDGDLAHLGPLALVAVAAAAEHHHQAVRNIGTQGVERLGERVGRVGIVDEDRSAAACRAGQIEPPARALQRGEHRQHGRGAGAGRRWPSRRRPARWRPERRRPAAGARSIACRHAR